MLSKIEKEILEFIDKKTWKSKQKIRWSQVEFLKARGKKLRFDGSQLDFEKRIDKLILEKLITSKNFPNVKSQEGLRPTKKGHQIIKNGDQK